MPFRTVKQHSDRGSIKDLQNGEDNKLPPTPFELRMKKLYEEAVVSHNQALIDSLGFIVINGATNDPISVFRHREYVNSLKEKLADKVTLLERVMPHLLSEQINYSALQHNKITQYKQTRASNAILGEDNLVKIAGRNPPAHTLRSFWRSKS